MKSVSRKIIALALAVVMMLSFSVLAFAENTVVFSADALDDGTFTITGVDEGSTEDGVFTVPASYEKDGAEYEITAVDAYALAYTEGISEEFLKDVTEIVIEDGVKVIGENAFMGFPAVTKITFKGDVEIGNGAFQDCPLLEKVVFEGSADIGEYAFAGCPALETIVTADGKTYNCLKSALADTAWYKNYTVDFVTLGTTLIEYKGADEEETLPLNITAIGASAFEGNTTLKKIVLTKYVDTIGDRAFADCTALEEVVFADFEELSYVGVDAFKGTPYFEDYKGEFFAIGDTLIKYMGDDVAFVKIPNTITAIAPGCFDGCYKYNEQDGYTFVISAIYVPASVTEFGEKCFDLAQFSDNESYSPRIFAYDGTPAYTALKEAGYLVTPMLYKKGDIDNDGAITAADARIALRLAVGLEEHDEFRMYAADIDGDNAVTPADARILLRIAVQLEDYTIEDLMNIPTTMFEIVHTYENALKEASKYKLGYTKTVSNKIVSYDINNAHADKLLSIAQRNSVNQTYKYIKDNQAAVDGLPSIDLQDLSLIKSARCSATDGKYVITIKLYNVQDADITSANPEYKGGMPYISSMIPVVSGKVFYNAITANSWWKLVPDSNTISPNCVRKYALTYTNPTVTVVIDTETGKPENIQLSVGYHFAVDGRINGLDISSKGFKTGDAIIDRLDTVTYSNFN